MRGGNSLFISYIPLTTLEWGSIFIKRTHRSISEYTTRTSAMFPCAHLRACPGVKGAEFYHSETCGGTAHQPRIMICVRRGDDVEYVAPPRLAPASQPRRGTGASPCSVRCPHRACRAAAKTHILAPAGVVIQRSSNGLKRLQRRSQLLARVERRRAVESDGQRL